jgi:hypothetical protein
MPKKSSATRKAQATRRVQQPAPKSQNVMLVRAGNDAVPVTPTDSAAPSADTSAAAASAHSSPAAQTAQTAQPTRSAGSTSRATATATRPVAATKSAAKPAPRPAATPTNSYASRDQERRVARAREMRRVRAANAVTAEHYRYVISDLRLTAILAAVMFAVIIVLHFVLS